MGILVVIVCKEGVELILIFVFQFDLQVEGTVIDIGNGTMASVLCIEPLTQIIEGYIIG